MFGLSQDTLILLFIILVIVAVVYYMRKPMPKEGGDDLENDSLIVDVDKN